MSRRFVASWVSRSFAGVGVAWASALSATGGCDPDLTVVARPAPALDAGGTPGLPPQRVSDASATAEADANVFTDAASTENDSGATGHIIDGANDFTAGENFATSAAGYTAYVSWDAKKVYFGMSGLDIASDAA